jgi:hypothetical protein
MIEHLPKSDGSLLLYEMNRIARKAFAISCPNGSRWQPPSSTHKLQAHISGRSYREFRSMGVSRIRTYHGLRSLTSSFMQKSYPIKYVSYSMYVLNVFVGKIFKSSSNSLWVEQIGRLPSGEFRGTSYTEKFLG